MVVLCVGMRLAVFGVPRRVVDIQVRVPTHRRHELCLQGHVSGEIQCAVSLLVCSVTKLVSPSLNNAQLPPNTNPAPLKRALAVRNNSDASLYLSKAHRQ